MTRAQGISLDWKAPAPWLFVGGGVLGAAYVTSSTLLIPRIGAAALMALIVAGQLIAGMLIDRIGFLGMAVREISLGRVAGAVLLMAARADPHVLHARRPFRFRPARDRIALRPASPRDAARLLVVRPGEPFEDRVVRDLPALLEPGDVLVFNDTKVIPAQLSGVRRRGDASAQVEATLHMRVGARPLAGLRAARQARARRATASASAMTGNACLLGALDATVVEKGEGGEVAACLRPRPARRSTRRCTPSAIFRCRPTSPPSAPEDERDRARLPDHLCPRGGRRRRADRRPAFHAGAVRSARRARASNGIS